MRLKTVLEGKHVEAPTVTWARAHGIKAKKLNGLGDRAWPDRLFLIPRRRAVAPKDARAWYVSPTLAKAHAFFIEFKRPGEEPTPLQWETIRELRAMGFDVEVHDSKETAIAALRERLRIFG